MSQAIRGTTAQAPAAVRGDGFKAELDGLRNRMRALGSSCDEVAAALSHHVQVRPRQACRLASGWAQDQAAARFNERAASEGANPDGLVAMAGPYLRELEQWPGSERKPPVYAPEPGGRVAGPGKLAGPVAGMVTPAMSCLPTAGTGGTDHG